MKALGFSCPFHALFIALFMPQAAVPDPEQCLPRLSWCSEHPVSLLGAGSGCSPRAELEESALQTSWPLKVCGEISSCQVVLVLLSLLLPGWWPWVQHQGYFLGSNYNKKPQPMVIWLWWPSLSVVSCSWGSPNFLCAQKCSARTIFHSLLPWSLVHSSYRENTESKWWQPQSDQETIYINKITINIKLPDQNNLWI